MDVSKARAALDHAAAHVAQAGAILDRIEYAGAGAATRDQAIQLSGAARLARLAVSRVENAGKAHAARIESEGGAE